MFATRHFGIQIGKGKSSQMVSRIVSRLVLPRILACLFAVGCLSAANVYAQVPGLKPVPVPASAEAPEGMKVINAESDGWAAEYTPDVEYVKRGELSLRLQILQPRDMLPAFDAKPGDPPPAGKLRPLIVYIQGSGWGPQNLYSAIPQLSELAHRGYVVASVEHRPSTEAQAPAQIRDVKTAIRFLRANAAKYRTDPKRVGIWGDSSGGHLAALVATSVGVAAFETEDFADQSDAVSALVDFFGPHDLTTMSDYPSWFDHNAAEGPSGRMLGHAPLANRANTLDNSPISYVEKERDIPPILLIHGDEDVIVPFNQSVVFYEALRKAGKDVTFYKVKGGNHGFSFWSPSIIKLVAEFFGEHLGE